MLGLSGGESAWAVGAAKAKTKAADANQHRDAVRHFGKSGCIILVIELLGFMSIIFPSCQMLLEIKFIKDLGFVVSDGDPNREPLR